jgi:putative flippase GtrA
MATTTSISRSRAAQQPLVFEPHRLGAVATVEIVLPVFNEQDDLAASVERLHRYLTDRFPLSWTITIADNASTDRTWPIACRLATSLDGVRAMHLDVKGRGRALRSAWSRSSSPVVAYMDIDLSTDLDALLPLVAPLVSGHSDLAIGSRLARSSRVVRGPRREAISRSYNALLRATLRAGFSDAQCGFKAGRTDVLRALLPMVEDEGWFFDTELLVLAERNGLRIHEIPVDWIDDPDSRVDVAATAKADLAGIWRLARQFARGDGELVGPIDGAAAPAQQRLAEQLVRFASIGVVSTMAFALLFVLLVGPVGIVAADVIALAACTLANTAANRRLTFALSGRSRRVRHHVRALVAALMPLSLNLVALALVVAAGLRGVATLIAAVTVANAVATLTRFTMLHRWVFDDGTV